MPRLKGTAAARKHGEHENLVESEEQVDFDGDNDSGMEEEVEYEEVEEEVEEPEEVEYEEVEEEEEEEEEVEPEEEGWDEDANIVDVQAGCNSDNEIETILDEDERKKHAELLALPPHGSELHFGGIPVDASEEDLKTFCESIGEVTEVKVVKDKRPGETRAYAFVTFKTKDLASKAIKDLNDSLFKGKKIKCSISQTKNRLFIGHIPRSWGEEELRKVVTKVGPGVSVIELVKDPQNSCRNRGFAFIEYYNHACADYSRKKMSKQEFKFDTNTPTVSWADPRNADSSASASASAQVKVVYVKNLPKDITQDQLRELFEHHGKITKVVLPPGKSGEEKNRFGFVYFEQKSSALKALKNTEKYEIEGQVLECSLAKSQPHGNGKADSGPSFRKPTLLPSYPPRMGYGLTGDAYGGVGGRYGAAGIAQPLMYGGMPTASGMTMMPMRLPDGRIGYVMQQPRSLPLAPPPQQRSSRSSGSRSSSGSRYSQRDIGDRDRDRDRRYRPY